MPRFLPKLSSGELLDQLLYLLAPQIYPQVKFMYLGILSYGDFGFIDELKVTGEADPGRRLPPVSALRASAIEKAAV